MRRTDIGIVDARFAKAIEETSSEQTTTARNRLGMGHLCVSPEMAERPVHQEPPGGSPRQPAFVWVFA
jgi:hypothetical protein